MNIGIIMPTYNAEKTITNVFNRVPNTFLKKVALFIVINDGSTDNTLQIVKKLGTKYPIKIINHNKNLGYGAAQKSGFREFLKHRLDIAVILHADGQYPPELLENIIKPVLNGDADIVGGSRLTYDNPSKQGMPLYKYIGNIVLTRLLNITFNNYLSCYHSGYKAYSRSALLSIDFNSFSDYFYFDTEMLIAALQHDLEIVEIPIPTYYGKEISYLNPIKYGFGIIRIIFGGLRNGK